jgi:hypothetical protein
MLVLLAACGAPAAGVEHGPSPTAQATDGSVHQLRCGLHGEVSVGGKLALDPHMQHGFAQLASDHIVQMDLVELRYRLGYYDAARVSVRAHDVTLEGWIHLSDLYGVNLVPASAGDDCLAAVPEIDPRTHAVCDDPHCRDLWDVPDGAHEVVIANEHAIMTHPEPGASVGVVEAGARVNVVEERDGWRRIAPLSWEFLGIESTGGKDTDADLWIEGP